MNKNNSKAWHLCVFSADLLAIIIFDHCKNTSIKNSRYQIEMSDFHIETISLRLSKMTNFMASFLQIDSNIYNFNSLMFQV